MKKIWINLPVDERHIELFEKQIEDKRDEYEIIYKSEEETSIEELKEMSVVIGALDPEIAPQAEKLEWLQLSWAGSEHHVKPGVLKETTKFTNASGAYGLSVSEHMVAVTFALIRHLPKYGRNQIAHEWKWEGDIISIEGSTVVVLGLGDIGGSYAKKMKALGAYVIGVRRRDKERPDYVDEQVLIDELDQVLPRADIVAMVLPGGDATTHLMDESRLRLMKKGAFLVNDGRGSAIDPDALKKVLAEDHLGGVALDVTEPEPLPVDDPLWDDPRVIITPHISGQFLLPKTKEKVMALCAENLYRFVHGQELLHNVDRATGY